jgi:thiamine-monophosphate kinase
VAVAGPLGHSAAGYALLTGGVTSCPDLVTAHLRPSPAYDAGPEAALLGATAMIDVSDGLLADLGHVAEASGVWIDIDSSALALGDPLAKAAAAVSSAPSPLSRTDSASSPASLSREWALTGGEDHSLVATFPSSAGLPARWRVIGSVHPASDAPAPASSAPGVAPAGSVTVNGTPHHGRGGWEHFR